MNKTTCELESIPNFDSLKNHYSGDVDNLASKEFENYYKVDVGSIFKISYENLRAIEKHSNIIFFYHDELNMFDVYYNAYYYDPIGFYSGCFYDVELKKLITFSDVLYYIQNEI